MLTVGPTVISSDEGEMWRSGEGVGGGGVKSLEEWKGESEKDAESQRAREIVSSCIQN